MKKVSHHIIRSISIINFMKIGILFSRRGNFVDIARPINCVEEGMAQEGERERGDYQKKIPPPTSFSGFEQEERVHAGKSEDSLNTGGGGW